MTFRTNLLKRVDTIRQIPQKLDLRQNRIYVVVRQWSGIASGDGTSVDITAELFISGTYRVRVRQITMADIVASNGRLTDQDIKVGPFTPEYVNGGVSRDVFDPPAPGSPREVLFRVEGHGMPTGGRWYKRRYDESMRNFTNMLYLTATGEQP